MINVPRTPADRLERVRSWVEALTLALESGDLDAVGRLFAIECSWQPGPFGATHQGRASIRAMLGPRLAAMPGLETTAEILGVGVTYAVVHWTLAWAARGAGERADGVLLVALDPMGRCSAVREWTLGDALPAPSGGPGG
jgi:limonene-1,2-epoxide hydrolase